MNIPNKPNKDSLKKRISLCEVCKVNESYGVYSSACGPISIAYCVECGRNGAEPLGLLAAYISGAVSKGSDAAPEEELINPSYQKIIDVSVKVANVTRDDFYEMIDRFIEKENEFYEGLSNRISDSICKENNKEELNFDD